MQEKSSKTFYPAVSDSFKDLEGDALQSQNYDREYVVCGSGLDVHYSYKIVDAVTNPEEPTMLKFNPRMNSGAVPPAYLGKSLPLEDEHNPTLVQDPLERSKKIAKTKSYYESLYDKYDPRRFTSMVVVRDYVCKQPVEVTNLNVLANAVLNEFPDEYVTYLVNFVDVLFGARMKAYLKGCADKYLSILADKEELNRISWTFYYAIKRPADSTTNTNILPDETLHWTSPMSNTLKGLTTSTDTPRVNVTPATDMIDLEPCIRSHIKALEMLHDGCKGFGTSETHARLMLEYANMQGRNLCDDLMLNEGGEGPDFDKVTLKIPVNMFDVTIEHYPEQNDPSMMGEVLRGLRAIGKQDALVKTQMLDIPVGWWGGRVPSTGLTFSEGVASQLRWGWGHPCNVFQKTTMNSALPGYVPFVKDAENKMKIDAKQNQYTHGLFDKNKWGYNLWNSEELVSKQRIPKEKKLTSLLEDEEARSERYRAAFRITTDSDFNLTPSDSSPPLQTRELKITKDMSKTCVDSVGLVSVKVFTMSHPMLMGEKCIRFEGARVKIPPSYFVAPTIFKSETNLTESLAKFTNLELKRLAEGLYRMQMDGSMEKPTPSTRSLGHYDDLDPSYKEVTTPQYPTTYRSGNTASYAENLIKNSPPRTTDPEYEKFIHFLNGMPSYDRNIYLIPSLKASYQDFANCPHSLRGKGMYKLSNPDVLKSVDLLDSRLKMVNARDRYILKLGFLRHALQFSYGMHTASLVFEELLNDHELIYLNMLDAKRRGLNPNDLRRQFKDTDDTILIEAHAATFGYGNAVISTSDEEIEKSFGFDVPSLTLSQEQLAAKDIEYDTLVLKKMMKTVVHRLTALFKFIDENGHKNWDTDSVEYKKALQAMIEKDWSELYKRLEYRLIMNTISSSEVDVMLGGMILTRHFGSNPVFAKHLLEATNPLSNKSCETLKHKFSKFTTLQTKYDSNAKTIHRPEYEGNADKLYMEEFAAKNLKEFGALENIEPPANDELLEEHLWEYHDVRCNYCSDLESYRYQLCENKFEDSQSSLKKAMKNMSEYNLPLNAIKEMKDGFDSLMYKIIAEMLYEDEFCYCRKHEGKDNCREVSYKGVSYRAVEDDKDYIPRRATGIQDNTRSGTYQIPYSTTQRIPDPDTTDHLLPVDESSHMIYTFDGKKPDLENLHYNNVCGEKSAMLFSMFDAAGFAWNNRKYSTPGETNRPSFPKRGHQDKMHYWSRVLTESFVSSRELYLENSESNLSWEEQVRRHPGRAFKSSQIGALCERTWKEQFPLLSKTHPLRAKMNQMRSLSVMWFELKSYKVGNASVAESYNSTNTPWIPLPYAHQMHLMKRKGLYDEKIGVPVNPWMMRNETGLYEVFNQSYHSPYVTTPESAHLKDWLKSAVPYKKPQENTFRPFSQYGGTPVTADFVHHLVEKPDESNALYAKLHKQMMYDRYGMTGSIKMGNMFQPNTGLLQDMFSFQYSASSKPTKDEKDKTCCALRVSNFMAYARVHALMALGSSNLGTEEISLTLAARNYFRLFVDTYQCAGVAKSSDGVPVIMGYAKKNTQVLKSGESAITLYAGTLNCINALMTKFCKTNGGPKCEPYKQLYLNDATLLFESMLRVKRDEYTYNKHYNNALSKDASLTPLKFAEHVRRIDKEHISFLQHIIIGMLYQMGYKDSSLPLNLLEPRDCYTMPGHDEHAGFVGQDFLSPMAKQLAEEMDFGSETMDRTQMAVLSLIPPDAAAITTMRIADVPELINTEFLKKTFEKKVAKDNESVWSNYAKRVVAAASGSNELMGKTVSLNFDMDEFKDPRREAEKVLKDAGLGIRLATNEHRDSSLSLQNRSHTMRTDTKTVSSRLSDEDKRALSIYDAQIRSTGGNKFEVLARTKMPDHMKKILAKKYVLEESRAE